MPTPTVSILSTIFNRGKFIEKSVQSVLNSSYKNWELILVDDNSSDDSLKKAKEFEKIDDRIKVYANEKNLGDYPNRNKAASLAKGKYLKYLDADDMIYPFGLEIMVDSMESFPDAALGISQEVVEDMLPYPFQLSPKETYIRQFIKKGVLDLGPTGTIIRKDVFEKLGGFSGIRYVGDTELWLKIAAQYPVVKIQPGLVYWRRHDNQEFNLGNLNDNYITLDFKVRHHALLDERCPLDDNGIRQQAILWLRFRHSRKIIHLLLKKLAIKRAWNIKKANSRKAFEVLLAFLPWKFYKRLGKPYVK